MSITLLLNSLAVGTGATLLALGAGLLVALAIAGAGGWARPLLLTLTMVNLALPPFLVANHWLDLSAQWRALAPLASLDRGSWLFTAFTLGSLLWPVTSLLLLGAWAKLQPHLLEVDPVVRGWALLSGLLVPAAAGELIVAAAITLTLALANFTVPVLFQVRVFTEEFWIRFNTQLDIAGALQATWPLLVLPWVVLALLRRREITWPRWQGGVPSGVFRRQLGGLWMATAVFTGCWLVLTMGFPLGRLVSTARTWSELPGAWAAGQRAVATSFLTATLTATIVAAAGLGLGRIRAADFAGERTRLGRCVWRITQWWRLHTPGRGRRGRRPLHAGAHALPNPIAWIRLRLSGRRRWFMGILWLPFLVPGVFAGVVLIGLFNRPAFHVVYQSVIIVVIALGVRYFAVGGSVVSKALAAADPALSDAARSLGAGPWRMFRDVVWPQVSRGCAAAWYTVYLLCLWDVESVVLIQPPGGETLALRIFNLLHYGHAAQVNALCVILLALALAPWMAWSVWGALRRAPVVSLPFRVLGLGALLAVSGCSPSSGLTTTPLESRFFSAVSVIGSRGVAPGQFNKPRSLICDRQDNLYVADLTGRIQKFSPDGHYLLQWQMPQTDLGKPKGMGLDRDGRILVIEPHYMRVNHFTPEGHRVAQWGVKGTNVGEFILPRGIAQDSKGDYFVSEYTVVDRIQRFTLRSSDRSEPGLKGGRCVDVLTDHAPRLTACPTAVWGSPGAAPGQFNRAEGVAVGPGDEVFVADSCNHRIQVFDRDGQFLRSHGQAGSHPGEFSYPYDVRVDSAGNQYVCEFGNSRITVLDAHDRVIEVIGGPGAEPGRFANPWAIALDSKGNLYIADSQNHRVQKLARRTQP